MKQHANMFYRIAGGLLLATAMVKFVSVFGHAKILKTLDPVFFALTTKIVLTEAGVFETAAGLILIFNKSSVWKWMTLFFICLSFWSYRLGVLFVAAGKPCPCLGTIFDWSPWLRNHGHYVALGILIFLTLCLIPCYPRFQSSQSEHVLLQN